MGEVEHVPRGDRAPPLRRAAQEVALRGGVGGCLRLFLVGRRDLALQQVRGRRHHLRHPNPLHADVRARAGKLVVDACARGADQPGLKEDYLKKAKAGLSALEGVLGTVTVTAPEGWKLQLDGNTETPAPARLHGKPGLRALSYRAPGKGAEKKEVSLEAGQKLAIALPEPPPQVVTPPEPPKEEKKAPTVVVQGEDPFVTLKKSAGLVVAGLGAATLVGSAILWSQAQGAGDSYNAAPTRTALDHGESMETWTTITLVTGGVLLAGGVALYLVPIKVKSSATASQSFRTAISPTLGGAMLRGQF